MKIFKKELDITLKTTIQIDMKLDTNFNIFPWDNDEKPYWVNPENGVLWYVDEELTRWASKGETKPLDAVCFHVCEKKDDEIVPISRVF